MDRMRPVTNIIELLECQAVKDLMTVNGFAWTGSAFNRFRALCICVERTPDTPIGLCMQTYLKDVFACNLPIDLSSCRQIWKETSDRLLLGDVTPHCFQYTENCSVRLPSVDASSPQNRFLLNDLRIESNDWEQWRGKAEEILSSVLKEGRMVGVEFPKGYTFEKTSLYNANRAIEKRDWNCPSWISQLVYFLCDFCASHDTRGGIYGCSDGADLYAFLQHVSKSTRLPNLCMGDVQADAEALLPICRLILSERGKREDGVPPVLVLSPS